MWDVVVLGSVLAGLGWAEEFRLRRARSAVPVRIHVNGTRGKSTVTRLLMGVLLTAGRRALGKVTGTEARWLLPDGTEAPVQRRSGRATIREQARALERAARLGCEALVLECMALHPEALWTSEHRMIQSTVGVITNVREDHGDVMGRDRAEIARTLANTIPVEGHLVVGDEQAFPLLAREARRRGTQPLLAPPVPPSRAPQELRPYLAWHAPENLGVVFQVAQLLGIEERVTWRGMAAALPEPGTARWTRVEGPGPLGALLIDGLAANDPDSLARVLRGALAACPPAEPFEVRVIYHHRHDRAERALRFGQRLPELLRVGAGVGSVTVWATGDPGGARLLGGGARQGPTEPGALLRRWRLRPAGDPACEEPPGVVVLAGGNTRGARGWQGAYEPWQPVPLGAEGRLVPPGEGGADHG
ncbi:poly-gamma-glutamate synthase PgsB [Limnochorda sp.]|nr:poly-gamma-glutamate synthase PgsB [Bacillota bacterium]